MKLGWNSFCHEIRTKGNAGSTCWALVFAVVFVYLWNFGSCTLAASIPFLALGSIVALHWFPVVRDGPKDREVVLVTGCDSGLGYSLALHLKSIGFRVIAGVHNTESPGALALLNLRDIFVRQVDITIIESVQNFQAAARDYLERNKYVLRAFVNNAGAMVFGEFEWQTEEQARLQIEVNLLGTMRVTREFMPIIRNHETRLIVVTSHCAAEPLPGVAAYGATKAGLEAWATSLRVELKKYGIDVINFIPGSFIAESNLLCQQRKYFEAMNSTMSDETRAFYGDYFTRYVDYLSNLAPSNLPKKLMDQTVYEKFEKALLDRDPRAVYRCEPWRYKFYRIMFAISPTKLRDRLVEEFVQMPAWKVNVRVKNAGEMIS